MSIRLYLCSVPINTTVLNVCFIIVLKSINYETYEIDMSDGKKQKLRRPISSNSYLNKLLCKLDGQCGRLII